MLVEPIRRPLKPDEYIRTTGSNYVSREASVLGAQNVSLKGRCIIFPEAVLRGEMAPLMVGRYCIIKKKAVLQPGHSVMGGVCRFKPLVVGSYTVIGKGAIVSAASVGAFVKVGEGCVLCSGCVIKDNCVIEAGAVVPEGVIVPPFSRVTGTPGHVLEDMPESTSYTHRKDAMAIYNSVLPLC